jgi:hypothetical protein
MRLFVKQMLYKFFVDKNCRILVLILHDAANNKSI